MGVWWVKCRGLRAVLVARGVAQARRFMEQRYGWVDATFTYVGQSLMPRVLIDEPVVLAVESRVDE